MNETKKIVGKIILFIFDILIIAYKIVKKVVLPNRKRKGNILSSFFIFFVSIIERVNHYEHIFFRPPVFFKLKYLKQLVIVIATFLFFLSSFEWTSNQIFNIDNAGAFSLQLQISSVNRTSVNKQKQVKCNSDKTFLISDYSEYKNILQCLFISPSSVKKYLLTRSLRI